MQNRLFVIGNGFDLAHGLPTNIKPDFKDVATSMDNSDFWSLYSCDEDNLWSDFEAALSKPEIEELLAVLDVYSPDYLSDHESDRDSIIVEVDLIGKLQEAVEVFAENAEQNLVKIRPLRKFMQCFRPDDTFITFNYTSTLENIYDVDESKVFHIHGHVGVTSLLLGYKAGTLDLGEVFVDVHKGRGYMAKVKEYIDDIEDYYVNTAYTNLIQKIEGFVKPSLVNELSAFVDSADISKIAVIGHSLGDCDLDYFSLLDKKYPMAHWSVAYHDDKEETEKRVKKISPTLKYKLMGI